MARRHAARLIAVLLTLLGAAGGAVLRGGVSPPGGAVALAEVPVQVGGYTSRDLEVPPRVLCQLRSDGLLLREYARPGEAPVWLYVDYHRRQRLGAQIHSPRICYPGAGWSVRLGARETLRRGGRDGPARWLALQRGDERRLVLYWYETRWGSCAREVRLKADLLRSAFARRATDAALIRFSTDVVGGQEGDARRRLLAAVTAITPVVRERLPFGTASS